MLILTIFLCLTPFFSFCYEPIIPRYELRVIAPLDLEERYYKPNSVCMLVPRLNNEGTIVYNTSEGGFTWHPNTQSTPVQIEGRRVFVHDINNKAKLLASHSFPTGLTQYFVCSADSFRRHNETPTLLVQRNDVSLNMLLDNGTAIGYQTKNGKPCAVYYSPTKKLQTLHNFFLHDANSRGSFVGIQDGALYYYPMQQGVARIDDQMRLNRKGAHSYSSLIVDNQEQVIGEIEESGKRSAFIWRPKESTIQTLSIKGFTPKKTNQSGLMVGEYGGKVAVATYTFGPLDLEKRLRGYIAGWKIEAITDMNDSGVLTGIASRYGTKYAVALLPSYTNSGK